MTKNVSICIRALRCLFAPLALLALGAPSLSASAADEATRAVARDAQGLEVFVVELL